MSSVQNTDKYTYRVRADQYEDIVAPANGRFTKAWLQNIDPVNDQELYIQVRADGRNAGTMYFPAGTSVHGTANMGYVEIPDADDVLAGEVVFVQVNLSDPMGQDVTLVFEAAQ